MVYHHFNRSMRLVHLFNFKAKIIEIKNDYEKAGYDTFIFIHIY